MADTRLTASSSTPLADKKQQADSKLDPALDSELLAYLSTLHDDHDPVNQALSQMANRHAEQSAQTAAWSGVIQVLLVPIKLDDKLERQRLQDLQNQLAELIAAEKKKQRKGLDGRETVIFEKLVSILGKPLAEQIALAIDKAITGQGAALQKDPAAVAKLSAELLSLLSSGDTLLKLGVSPQEAERVLQRCFTTLERSLVQTHTVPVNRPDPIAVVGTDLIASAKTQPQALVAHLKTQAGADLLRSYLASQNSADSRIEVLRSLQSALGPERFAAVVDSYDRLTGRPLVFDCIQLSATAEVDQKKILQGLLDPSRSILNSSQLDRLSQFVVSDAAAIIQSLKIEYAQIPHQITEVERGRITSYSHLASALGIETPSGLSVDASREQILRAIVGKFPGLTGRTWEEVSKALYELAGTADSDSFALNATRLGISLVPADFDRTALANLPEAERLRVMGLAQGEFKELAVRLLTHMRDITDHEQQLVELRAMLEAGPQQEEAKVMARLEALYAGVIGGFSAESVARQGEASRIYIEGLHTRIDATTDPLALQVLCAERDSLQWRALQVRINTLLDQKPAAVDRVSALLIEYQTALAPGLRGRSTEFFQAAGDVLNAVQATTSYFQEVTQAFATEKEAVTAELSKLDKLRQEQVEAVKQQEAVVKSYMTSWFNNYKQDKKKLDDLKLSLQKTEERCAQLAIDLKRLEPAREEALALREGRLAHVGSVGLYNLAAASPRDVAARCALTRDSSKLNETLQAKLLAADEASSRAQAALTRVELVGRTACMRREFSSAVSASTARIQQIFSHERAMQPAPEALQALRGAVSTESSLGKALAAISSSSRPTHELIDLLFARLSYEDVMRVKAFLLTYDRPDLFERIGRDAPVDSQGVWYAIAALEQSEQSQELSELLVALPALRTLLDCEEFFASQHQGARVDSLLEYERIAGSSLGQILLAKAPASEPARSQYLMSLCGSPLVTSDDLGVLFPGGVVPSDAEERQQRLAEALQRDSQIEFKLPAEFEQLVQLQSNERAALQVALSTMVQLGREADVEKIRRRLAELDSQFYRPLQTIFTNYSADFLARTGMRQRLEGAREAATQMSKMSLVDPYGDLAQDARKLANIIQRDDVSSAQVLEHIRGSNPSPERMMLLDVLYLQYVSSRPFLGLSGDLRKDVATRKGFEQYEQEQLGRLLQGEKGALAEYDLEMLSRGLRTKDPTLTGRAILAIQGKELGKDALRAAIETSPEMKRLWQEYVASPVSREAVSLYNAVMTDDRARIALVKTMNGLAWSYDKGADAVTFLAQYKDKVAEFGGNTWAATESMTLEIYGTPFGQKVAGYAGAIPGVGAQAWSDFVNSEPGAQMRAGLAFAKQALQEDKLNPARLAELIYMIPVEHRRAAITELGEFASRIDESAVYQDGRSEAILLDYIRRKGGATGDADAALIQGLIASTTTEVAASREVVGRYQKERERLMSQLEDIATLGSMRKGTLDQAIGFRDTVGTMDQSACKDRDNRLFGKGSAQVLVDTHTRMLVSQNSLIRGMQLGVTDIETTKEVMRVRAVAILKDLTVGQDRGLSSDQNDRDFGALRQRDVEREWAVARRDHVVEWQVSSELAQKALANFDWWFEVGHSAVKIAVIVGLSLTGVGAPVVFGVATAWNLADKTYKVAYRGMSLREATRQFALELAIDAVCAGAWRLAIRVPTPWFKHVSQFARDNVVVKNTKVLLGKLPGFRPKGEIVNPETFKSIRGFFGQTRLASKVEKLVEKTLTQANAKIADPLLFAKDVKYSYSRIWLPTYGTVQGSLLGAALSQRLSQPPADVKPPPTELDGGGLANVGSRKAPTFDIPGLHVKAQGKNSADAIADLLERATQLGKDSVANLTKQALDASKSSEGRELLALVDGWMRDLGAKFTGQQPESLLRDLQSMIDSIRAGTLDVSALYPYIPPLMFLLGVNPAQLDKSTAAQGDQQQSPHEWKDYSDNFKLFDGVFKFLNPGWAGLWMAYKDNAPGFPPAPPPVQPPPPPQRKPDGQGGPGAGTVPGLSVHMAIEGQKRRPVEIVETRADSDSSSNQQAQAAARQQTQELANRKAQEQVLSAIEQALQAHTAGVTHAQSIRQRLESVEQNGERLVQQQGTAVPVMKSTQEQIAISERNPASSQLESEKALLERAVAANAVQEVASRERALANSRTSEQARTNVEHEYELSMALRSKKPEAPKIAAKISSPEQINEQQEQSDVTKDGLSSASRSTVESRTRAEELASRNLSRHDIEQVTALRASQKQAAGLVSPPVFKEAVSDKKIDETVARGIDASALSHSEVVDGLPGQKSLETYQEFDTTEPDMQEQKIADSDSEEPSARAGKKKRKNKLQLREEARLRQIIMHQLLTQTLERAKREKLLRMLAALGMTEQEYRAFLTRLHDADAKREEAARIKDAQKIALAVEPIPQSAVPTMKQDVPKTGNKDTKSPKTRAELFARLRNQHADKIH